MIVDGLSWWQSWLCVWFGYGIAAVFVVAMGRVATIYHVPFAVANRASFGVWGSFWPVLNRAAMAVIWYGVQVCSHHPISKMFLTAGHRHTSVVRKLVQTYNKTNDVRSMRHLDDRSNLAQL